jgi:dTDP-4-amino-4,6-dideoxygalactose transaminase
MEWEAELAPSLHGDAATAPRPWNFEMAEPGFNYRLTDIYVALGLSQLAKLPAFRERRAALAWHYDQLLLPHESLAHPVRSEGVSAACLHLYPCSSSSPRSTRTGQR